MKTLIAAALCLLSTAALAADPAPKPANSPSCGKTADECEKVVQDLNFRLSQMTLSFQAERQQRINNQTALGDQTTQAFVAQQAAAKK